MQGLFALTERLFGFVVEQAPAGEVDTWHEDVMYFRVRRGGAAGAGEQKAGEEVASFFLDPYSRPADKNGGAWMNGCLGRSKTLGSKPVAYLICNQAPPDAATGQPSLMSLREVETLFHEFGHGLQHMLTEQEWGAVAGINGVEWDAVELPSQFMENWVYDGATMASISKHVGTGEALPDELFGAIRAARTHHAGMAMLRQLYFGMLDLTLHSDGGGGGSALDVQRRIAQEYSLLQPLEEDCFLCAFSHIFGGGYAAGYFSYKWAEVLSQDAFGAFEEAGLDDEAAVAATGRRFRDTVLAMGGGRHPMDVFKDFRGREPSVEALLRTYGLEK